MGKVNRNVRELVFQEVSRFSKTRVELLKDDHKLKADLRLVRPAIVHLAGVLRRHIWHRDPSQTLLTTELEKANFTIKDTVDLVQKRMGEGARPWNTAGLGLPLLLLLLCPALANAQSARDWAWWVEQFELRKAFDGGRNEQEPATVAHVNPGDGPDFWLVDLAVKHRGLAIAPAPSSTGAAPLVTEFFLAPSFEWHRNTAEPLLQSATVNKISASLIGEIYFRDLFPNRASIGATRAILLSPGLFLKGTATRNALRDMTEASVSLFGSPYSEVDWVPGALSRIAGRPFLRYVPYVGVEYFNNLAISANNVVLADAFSGWFTTARLYVEAFPTLNPLAGQNRLVLTGELIYRVATDTSILDSALTMTTVSLTFYFDEAQTVGLGYSYESGENPRTNLVLHRRSFVAFRAKL
jgi:hypothetical protein